MGKSPSSSQYHQLKSRISSPQIDPSILNFTTFVSIGGACHTKFVARVRTKYNNYRHVSHVGTTAPRPFQDFDRLAVTGKVHSFAVGTFKCFTMISFVLLLTEDVPVKILFFGRW